MSRVKKIPVLFLGGASMLTALLAALLLASGLFGLNDAEATQPPPPPPSYTVAVGTSGGDSTCQVRILAPGPPTEWGSTASGTFTSGTGVDLQFRINCPIFYSFDHWESNDEELDGQGSHGGHSGDFFITKNTTATAVFVPYCPGQVVLDMYNNSAILGSDNLQYTTAPGCKDLVTDEAGCYDDYLYVNPGNFSYAELDCNHAPSESEHPHWQWDNGVSDLFQAVRNQYGSAITVTSAYRCPLHNTSIGSNSTSAHPKGRAFDFDNGTNQANWNIAVAASSEASDDRIFLYGGGPDGYRTYEWLLARGFNGTTLPSDFTNGYTNGHADNQ